MKESKAITARFHKYALLGLLFASLCFVFILFLSLLSRQRTVMVDDEYERLKSLPYVDYVVESEARKEYKGVILYNKQEAYEGINQYNRMFKYPPEGFLMDMEGRIIHKWIYKKAPGIAWQITELNRDGSLIVLLQNSKPGLVKLDWNSKTIFEVDGDFHHDLDIAENGDIYVLSSKEEEVPFAGRKIPVKQCNYITILSKDGKVIREISLYEIFKDTDIVTERLKVSLNSDLTEGFDLFHANTLEILKEDIEGVGEKGDILICHRVLDTVAIISLDTKEIVWAWGEGLLEYPHHPTFLKNGNILIFDNGKWRKYSRIIEVNPKTKRIEWSYSPEPKTSFFSAGRGGNQRFPNGNTLITESNTGRVFEINPNKEIVWEWFNPSFSKRKRNVIYRMRRYDKDYFDGFDFNYGVVPQVK